MKRIMATTLPSLLTSIESICNHIIDSFSSNHLKDTISNKLKSSITNDYHEYMHNVQSNKGKLLSISTLPTNEQIMKETTD
jgi:hypothetical protein